MALFQDDFIADVAISFQLKKQSEEESEKWMKKNLTWINWNQIILFSSKIRWIELKLLSLSFLIQFL